MPSNNNTFIIITWPAEFERSPELHGPFADADMAEAWSDALCARNLGSMLDEAFITITTPGVPPDLTIIEDDGIDVAKVVEIVAATAERHSFESETGTGDYDGLNGPCAVCGQPYRSAVHGDTVEEMGQTAHHPDVIWDDNGEPAEIKCTIAGCPSEGTLQRVVRSYVGGGSDPTQVYELACGSKVI